MKMLFALILAFLPTLLEAQEAPRSIECSSIASILANSEACDKQPVHLAGKVTQFKFQTSNEGKPYTEFTLADGSKKLTFFSYDHPSLEKGTCVRVEGIYHIQRDIGPYTFKNQVVVEKKAEGIAPVPCPPGETAVITPSVAKKRKVPSASSTPVWSWSEILNLGISILILLVVVGILILIRVTVDVFRRSRYHPMGRAFEEYVIGLFPESEWEIEDRSSDTSKRIGRRVTGDVSYDCIMKHRRTSKRFIVQCKYRSRFFRKDSQEGIEWAEPYQIKNYRDFQRTKGWPYVGIIGVGGRPRHPKYLFVLPLEQLHDTFIRKAGLEIGGRDPHRPFTVGDQGTLA